MCGYFCIGFIDFMFQGKVSGLKAEVDKIDLDKLKIVPADLSKLSKVVEYDVVKKILYDQLVTKVNNKIPCTSGLVPKTQYDSKKQNLEKRVEDVDKKIPNPSRLVKKTDLNAKITEIENKISYLNKADLNIKLDLGDLGDLGDQKMH